MNNDNTLLTQSKIVNNRNIRSEMFDNGLYELVRKYQYNEVPMEILREFKHMKALQVNRWKRNKRIREHLENIISKPSLFLTLTFTNEVLASTTEATRRRYVYRLLGAFKVPYIANIDFGNENEYIDDNGNARKGTKREHYHAVIQLSEIDPKKWEYGSIDFLRVYNTNDLRMARYLTKLQYHAIKSPKRLIYPKLAVSRENITSQV
ncbi:MAG: hypothetical protein EOM59_21760 [Clostridia bacterium]|nr:hypothetical protein [Clostridia bacterium]